MNDLHIVSWNITRRCNLSCAHCYLPAVTGMERPGPASDTELAESEAFRLIDQVAEVSPEVMLIISGGEPLLREDVFALSAYAAGKGMMVVLGSSGLLIDDKVARRLRESGVSGISISLDSMDSRLHDSIRRHPGAWRKAVAAIERCRDAGLSVQINTVVTRGNCGELPALIDYSRSLGARVFSPFFLVCTGRGEKLTDLSPSQHEEILSSVVDLQARSGGIMVRTRCAPTVRRILYDKNPESPLLKLDAGRCLAGLSYCRISPEGDVTPCPYMPLSAGNVRARAFGDIWLNSGLLHSLRTPALKGKCSECDYRLLCGGCRARAYAACKDYLEEDPWCHYVPSGGKMKIPPSFEGEKSESARSAVKPIWTKEAEERLKRVPMFVRGMVRRAVERHAEVRGMREITPALMEEVKKKGMGGGFGGN
ncbi:MAG TPA: radical SAM protein [Nitrospirota bacterium]|nr:radical SAM protein [Nitrospirota bacterium]